MLHCRRNRHALLQEERYRRALGNIPKARPLFVVQFALKVERARDRVFLIFLPQMRVNMHL